MSPTLPSASCAAARSRRSTDRCRKGRTESISGLRRLRATTSVNPFRSRNRSSAALPTRPLAPAMSAEGIGSPSSLGGGDGLLRVLLSELELEHLAARVAWQLVDDHDARGLLVGGQPLPAPVDDL